MSVDHPGFEEASGSVGAGVSHMSLGPINGMSSGVCIFC